MPKTLTKLEGERLKPGPKPKLDYSEQLMEQIRALGRIQATVEETAAVLRVSLRTLQNFFTDHPEAKDAHEFGKLEGCASLRRKQFALAEKNAGMAIFLGKNYLGQRDVQQIETGGPGDFDQMSNDQLRDFIRGEVLELKIVPELSALPAPETRKPARRGNGKH
jgi:hypothetical protein